uniref:Protein TIFY n=1 Tax=Nelumbo nucifera TaxID=4432 RepID=A0A822ZV85_NELNU|nr:TPA_asm: hypothetical protein HUJ06_019089 [Nelumbo nucifera]
MTIFYAGKVLVFDDFPAEKAKEVMLFASKASSLDSSSLASTSGGDQPNSGGFASSCSNVVPISAKNPNQDRVQLPPQPNGSGTPLVSLKFLALRTENFIGIKS